ncbi:MAG: glycogen synthase [Patescibacteria group bacterium]|jgi:starch synthase
MTKSISVAFVASELTPIAKVGGLADVTGALPPALKELGVDIRVILPFYQTIDRAKYPVKLIAQKITVPLGESDEAVSVYEMPIPGTDVPIYLIENGAYLSHGDIYFERSAFASRFVEFQRFLFFVRSVPRVFKALNWQPDVIHCQDWQTAMLPSFMSIDNPDSTTPSLYTIHNIANQGVWIKSEVLNWLGLTEDQLPTFKVRPDKVNIMQQGIINGQLINTVSRTYAKEILTPEYGCGLEDDLRKRRHELSGIVNGVDQIRFNSATDPEIVKNFTVESLDDKAVNKQALQKSCGLAINPTAPLFGLVTRLTDQKGIELIAEVLPKHLAAGAQFVALGQGGEKYETMLRELAKNFPQSASVTIGFNAKLAQEIYASSDFFLMPSRFEPCGLGQLIAMRYGTIPIVRATGGLKDTVTDRQESKSAGNGYVFAEYTPAALEVAVSRAITLYHHDPAAWRHLQIMAMRFDSSWHKAAEEYLQLYRKLVQ